MAAYASRRRIAALSVHTPASTIMDMDLFAAVLDDTSNVDAKVEATATLALSQGMAATELEAIPSDDCTASSEVPAVSMATPHLPDTPEKVHKVSPSNGGKRKHNPKNSLQLKRIPFVDGDSVPCVFVENGAQQSAVPLWCQYAASRRNVDSKAPNGSL